MPGEGSHRESRCIQTESDERLDWQTHDNRRFSFREESGGSKTPFNVRSTGRRLSTSCVKNVLQGGTETEEEGSTHVSIVGKYITHDRVGEGGGLEFTESACYRLTDAISSPRQGCGSVDVEEGES